MIEVKDEILSGEPLYDISDSQGNLIYSGVRIELITALVQQGTPLNKLLFDSINSSINERLLITSKATETEAVNGTDDTKYLTPLKLRKVLEGDNYNYIKKEKIMVGDENVKTIDLRTYLSEYTDIIIELNVTKYFGDNTGILLQGSDFEQYGTFLYRQTGGTVTGYCERNDTSIWLHHGAIQSRFVGEVKINNKGVINSKIIASGNLTASTGLYEEMTTFDTLTSIRLPAGDWAMYGIK